MSDEKVWVMVETIGQYRMRYMVEAPATNPEYALDDVTCEDAKEFSQLWLGETIVSHRVVTEDEAIAICDVDNDYTKSWSTEQKINTFFTKEGEGNGMTKYRDAKVSL
jgi:phage tail sheath protein FI